MRIYCWYYAFGIFFSCLLIHVLLWRVKRPLRQASALFLIFIGLPVIFSALVFGISLFSHKNCFIIAGLTGAEWALVLLLDLALSAAYILTYPAAQAISPSLKILLIIGGASPTGVSYEEMVNEFPAKDLFDRRVEDLFDEELIREESGGLVLTSSGAALARVFILIRKLLGLPAGKG